MKTLKGRLTIGKPSGGSGPEEVRIELIDDAAGVIAVEVRMPLESFAMSLFARGQVPCEFEWNDNGYVGKKREHKTEIVFIPSVYGLEKPKDRKAVADALKPYEVDGWQARERDAVNGHNRRDVPLPEGKQQNDGRMMAIVFERWVETEA